MSVSYLVLVFFIYGLAFFGMGLIVAIESDRGSDPRLRHALPWLAVFGIIHGIHEWVEIFQVLEFLPYQQSAATFWHTFRTIFLGISFLMLSAFGASLLAKTERARKRFWIVPTAQAILWGVGLLYLRMQYPPEMGYWDVADVWCRYMLAIPSALIATSGLLIQQREFIRLGHHSYGRDSVWAGIAFTLYGLIGQVFTRQSPLPPSNVINQELFFELFGFPVQLLRAGAAILVAIFVVRFLRLFEYEKQREIADLQAARLEEAQRREILRGELLRRVVEAQEAERQRIARELHDETGQALTSIGLQLRGISGMLSKNIDQSSENLRQLEDLVAQSLDELQRLISDLRPSHLDDLGLSSTLRWYINQTEERTSIKAGFSIIGEPKELNPAVKTVLFRVAQEALTNVVKHAQTDRAELQLLYEDDCVTIRVEDKGCGFNLDILQMGDYRGWGLEGMRERAALLGGEFEIYSRPGAGTTVEVSIPYDMSDNGEEREMRDDD